MWASICVAGGGSWGARNILCLDSGCGHVGGYICKTLSTTRPYVFSGTHNIIYNILQPKTLKLNLIKTLDLTSSFQEMQRKRNKLNGTTRKPEG